MALTNTMRWNRNYKPLALIGLGLFINSCLTFIIINPTKVKNTTKTIKKPLLRTKNTFIPTFDKIDPITKTVEGESYTIQELFKRHLTDTMPSIGRELPEGAEEATHDDDVALNAPDVDLTDIDIAKDQLLEFQEKVNNAKTAKQEKAAQAKLDSLKATLKLELESEAKETESKES